MVTRMPGCGGYQRYGSNVCCVRRCQHGKITPYLSRIGGGGYDDTMRGIIGLSIQLLNYFPFVRYVERYKLP